MTRSMKCIWPEGKYREKNYHCAFLLQAQGLSEKAILRLAAENLYRVHVNGAFVGAGPIRCAHCKSQIDEFPLISFLDNRQDAWICVEVTGYNISVLSDANDPPFFAAEVTDGEFLRYDSEDFIAFELTDALQVVPRYSWQRHFLECYRMERDRRALYVGDTVGFRVVKCNAVRGNHLSARTVSYPDYKCVLAQEVVERGAVGFDPNAPVYQERYLYDIEDNGYPYESIEHSVIEEIRCFTYQKKKVAPSGTSYALYDLGRDHSGFLHLKCSVKTPARVYLLWDEVLGEDGHINPLRMRMANVIRLELDKGIFDFFSMEPYTMRYIKVIVTAGEIKVENVGVRLYENPDVFRLQFSCADRAYERLIQAAQRTLAQNSTDIFMDCPSRERAGWLCDSFFMGSAEWLLSGENKVERHFLNNFVDCPQYPYFPKGMIPQNYPGEFPLSKSFIPNWAMWYILELRAYFKRTGDRELIDRSQRVVDGLLAYFENLENEFELLEDLENWVFVEWSRANDFVDGVNFPSNMLYSGVLDTVAVLYNRPALGEKADRIRKRVRQLSLGNGLFYRDHAVRREGKLCVMPDRTETCQYYAFYFGVATPENDSGLLSELLMRFGYSRDMNTVYPDVHKSNAFIGNLMRLMYLSENGYENEALEQTVEFYLYMVDITGTLWEYDTSKKSCCHGFASYISLLILRGTLGYDGRTGNTLTFLDQHGSVDCEAKIPLSATKYLYVCVKNGKRTVKAPEGFTVRICHRERKPNGAFKMMLEEEQQLRAEHINSENISAFRPCSHIAKMQVLRNTTVEGFVAYCKQLERLGYTHVADHAFGENLFTTYAGEHFWVYASYHAYSGEIHVICDLPRKAIPAVFVETPQKKICFAQYDTVCSYCNELTGVACGMGYLFRLADNRLIAIDGGLEDDCVGFCDLMRKLTGEERPRVALWIITHPHGDHYGALKKLSHSDAVDIEAYYSCMPPDRFKPHGCRDMLTGIKDYDEKNITAHTGDKFYFGELCMETLITCEEMLLQQYEQTYTDTNNLSLMLRFSIQGQTLLFAADARTPEYGVVENIAGAVLKSDILQVSHHGRTGRAHEDQFVCAVSPRVALWPGNRTQIAADCDKGANNWIRSADSSVKEHFVANDGCVILDLPYEYGSVESGKPI